MKWTIIILVVLGLLAAVSASVLVSALRVNINRGDDGGGVVIATKSLPAMSVITADHIKKDQVPMEDLPEGFLTNPTQAIGRVIGVPMVEGQVLTDASFITSGSEAQLAAALPHGMRAVSITLPRESVTGGLLYPGCVVDVLASFRLSSVYRAKGEAISTTLLHNIQVWAVEKKTIVSKPEDEIEKATKAPQTSRNITVTVIVDPRQAEALQLAMKHGNVSLALRNPLDKYPVDFDATVLSEGRLAKLGSILDSTVVGSEGGDLASRLAGLIGSGDPNDPNYISAQEVYSQGQEQSYSNFFSDGSQQSYSPWLVTVIRGAEIKDEELKREESEE
jgi:pilus assembly protein CpaB